MEFAFSDDVVVNSEVKMGVSEFFESIETREKKTGSTIIICQDGKSRSYYVICSISTNVCSNIIDLDARLDPSIGTSFRANRELLLKHNTYLRMKQDTENGREFNDIIVEYNKEYSPDKPLKVWGGQHRSKAIQEAFQSASISRYHGFRVYFCLTKEQRTELALISNINIAVSNDLFDRLQEETFVGTELREWCWKVGFLKSLEDFPDRASSSEKISVRLARTFIVNFFLGKERGQKLDETELDKNVYEPYLCESGASLDQEYENYVNKYGQTIWTDGGLIASGKAFTKLHHAQQETVKNSKGKIKNLKGFRNKALLPSVLAGWSYVAGLLQSHPKRLKDALQIPKITKKVLDPLNAHGMSNFRHDSDPSTYRGVGTRSDLKDRQRMAQIFLAMSAYPDKSLDHDFIDRAISQVQAIKSLQRGYRPF